MKVCYVSLHYSRRWEVGDIVIILGLVANPVWWGANR